MKPTKPSPKMAKFVLITCAAFFFCVKPVSTSAKPACMKITRTAPMTTHSRLVAALSWVTAASASSPASA